MSPTRDNQFLPETHGAAMSGTVPFPRPYVTTPVGLLDVAHVPMFLRCIALAIGVKKMGALEIIVARLAAAPLHVRNDLESFAPAAAVLEGNPLFATFLRRLFERTDEGDLWHDIHVAVVAAHLVASGIETTPVKESKDARASSNQRRADLLVFGSVPLEVKRRTTRDPSLPTAKWFMDRIEDARGQAEGTSTAAPWIVALHVNEHSELSQLDALEQEAAVEFAVRSADGPSAVIVTRTNSQNAVCTAIYLRSRTEPRPRVLTDAQRACLERAFPFSKVLCRTTGFWVLNKSAMVEEVPTNTDLRASLLVALEPYPNLSAVLPLNYPCAPKFKNTLDAMHRRYHASATKAYWHDANLPLVLHYTNPDKHIDARTLMGSVLRTLDTFVDRFGSLPGLRETLEPLWDDAWSPAPILWSVACCAFTALDLDARGHAIEGFELKIGSGEPDADLTFKLKGQRVHVDVEMWHRTRLDGLSEEAAAAALLRRADEKVGKKFQHLPKGEIGIAQIVCAAGDEQFPLLNDRPELLGFKVLPEREDRYAWISSLIGLRDDAQRLHFGMNTGFDDVFVAGLGRRRVAGAKSKA